MRILRVHIYYQQPGSEVSDSKPKLILSKGTVAKLSVLLNTII